MAIPIYAFVTLVSSDSYLPGARALAAALKDVHPSPPVPPQVDFQTVCLVTPETVSVSTVKHLRNAFDLVVGVEVIDQEDSTGLELLGRLDLNTVLTKLHVFRLTQFSKIIFLDADVLPIHPISHLFTIPHEFSAVPDVGWPDIFNSGVIVLSPGEDKFTQLIHLFKSKGSWDGGDQGLLNEWRGGNWNRLSFIYNTTPTAAYTYAPAYERFGSQISAIHFIGPNKPWNDLPSRIPFSNTSTSALDSHQTAYDYNSLVDQWYAVYDQHYRSQDIPLQTKFEVMRYEPAWKDVVPGNKPSDNVLPKLTLEELRRLAIEGMNSSSRVTYEDASRMIPSGNGEYQSMPLDGRLDLMRPRAKPKEPEQVQGESKDKLAPEILQVVVEDYDPQTPPARHIRLPSSSPLPPSPSPPPRRLSTPGPNEIPPSPHPRTIALPPFTPPHQQYIPHQYFPPPDPESPSHVYGLLSQPQEHQQLLQENRRTSIPGSPEQHVQLHIQQSQPQNHQQLSQEIKRPLISGHPLEHIQLQNQDNQPNLQPQPRSRSPTMLVWNPAVDPPPSFTPTPSAFPSETYFPNIWDATSSKKNDYTPQSRLSAPDSSTLFEPLPQPGIPEPLIRQGHYRNVTGEGQLGATPSPDRTKVKHVFPWEEKPRHLPGRVFPATDPPKAYLFLSPENQTSSPEMPTTPESKSNAVASVLSPLPGFLPTFTYLNAWDTIPSIQKYAERLSQTPPPRSLAPAFEDKKWSKRGSKRWDEDAEVSSRDGDVEDEGDDTADEESPKGRSRHGSSAGRPIKTKKLYKEAGVQTTPREMHSQGVQTTTLSTPVPTPDTGRLRRPTMSSSRHWVPSSRPEVLPSVTVHDVNIEPDRSTSTVNLSPASDSQRQLEKLPSRSPMVRSPTSVPHPPQRSGVSTDITTLVPKSIRSPSAISRETSNDSSLGSPPSSIGPMSPLDGQPINAYLRKGGRVWDPARGVELFKRGSEEVLARFLKMGSWEDEHR